jgi:6-pyruvoyltetrahydropterin/6-carboxytetrahydropterin synthase
MQIKSSKAFHKLPCAHAQFQDFDGPCKTFHGYDRSVIFEFSGTPDQYGWLVGFGQLKPVRTFLEYMFDHTTIAPANDPRLADIEKAADAGLFDLRVLPYGVSMEMSALFIWEQVNPYIYKITDGRAMISKVECREHDSNGASIEVDTSVSKHWKIAASNAEAGYYLTMQPKWSYIDPAAALLQYQK